MGPNIDRMNNNDFSEATQSFIDLPVRDKDPEKFMNREKESQLDIIAYDPPKYNHDFIA